MWLHCSATTHNLCIMLQGLAKSIAWDGEGATCLMEVSVTGAKSDGDARTAAKSVAGSSLVKSAIFGHDPNWGRIAAAAGYSGELVLGFRVATTCLLCGCSYHLQGTAVESTAMEEGSW